MKNIENKLLLFLPQLNDKKENKNKSQLIKSKQFFKTPTKSSISLGSKTNISQNQTKVGENYFNSKIDDIRNNKFYSTISLNKKRLESSQILNKNMIKLSQVNLSLKIFPCSSNVSLNNENKFPLKNNYSTGKFNLQDSPNAMRSTGLPINLCKIKKNFLYFSKSKFKSSNTIEKNIKKVIELKFNLKSPIDNFINKYNLNNVYPQFIKNNVNKQTDRKNYINDNNKEVFDCDELIKNFDDLKENDIVETLNLKSNISFFK